jgi:hypothetical protein
MISVSGTALKVILDCPSNATGGICCAELRAWGDEGGDAMVVIATLQ